MVGSRWTAPLIGHFLLELGQRSNLLVLDALASTPAPPSIIHIGNGEYFANARRVFGVAVAEKIWDLSLPENFHRAKELLEKLGSLSPGEGKLQWFAAEGRERTLQEETASLLPATDRSLSTLEEPHLRLDSDELSRSLLQVLERSGIKTDPIESLLSINKKAGLEVELAYRCTGKTCQNQASALIIATDEIPNAVLPWLSDKRIPITLSSFSFPAKVDFGHLGALFNRGADFAIPNGQRLRLGSFRNLYQDKAVGWLPDADRVTFWENAREFFAKLGFDSQSSPGPNTLKL